MSPNDDDTRSHSSYRSSFEQDSDPTISTRSPPTSAVSYSSRSSLSRGSSSAAPNPAVKLTHNRRRSSLALRLQPPPSPTSPILAARSVSESSTDGDAGLNETSRTSEEDEIQGAERAEAKSNRKMADLEITNRSLTAINSVLEATRHRQAKEIRELRRKLRESRLVLPPSTYRTLKHEEEEEEEEEDEVSEDESDIVKGDGPGNEGYQRVRLLLENLIETGKRALESTSSDFGTGAGTRVTVLSAEEVEDLEESDDPPRTISPSRVAIPESNGSLLEDEDDDDDDDDLIPPIRIMTPV